MRKITSPPKRMLMEPPYHNMILLRNDLSCVKYEVKKFKEQTVPAVAPIQERTFEAPAILDDLLGLLSAEENNSNEANDLDNQTQEQTNSICQKQDKLKCEL